MRPRIKIGRFLVRFGKFVQSLALMVMKPDDLDEYTRQMYSRSNHVDAWSGDEILNRGLYPREEKYLEHIPVKKGSLLLLGVGGGREAIPMAERGFEVTGVDFVPEMVKRAEENALKKGLKINGSVQNISELNFPDSTFDIVWLSYNMYSGVPTRKKRIRMLKKINKILDSNGYFLCQFFWYSKPGYPKKIENLRKDISPCRPSSSRSWCPYQARRHPILPRCLHHPNPRVLSWQASIPSSFAGAYPCSSNTTR